MVELRALEDLLSEDPARPLVREWIAKSENEVGVLPPDERSRGRALTSSQVTTRSPLGAVIYETGGLVVDSGWLRILGSGSERFPRLLVEKMMEWPVLEWWKFSTTGTLFCGGFETGNTSSWDLPFALSGDGTPESP